MITRSNGLHGLKEAYRDLIVSDEVLPFFICPSAGKIALGPMRAPGLFHQYDIHICQILYVREQRSLFMKGESNSCPLTAHGVSSTTVLNAMDACIF